MSDPYARLQARKKGKPMKAVKVTSIGQFGEQTVSHPISDFPSEDAIILATLRGIINAGHAIKAFEIVEVQ